MNIKDPEVYAMARKLADLRGETLTDAVRAALREKLDREQRSAAMNSLWMGRLIEISDSCSKRPILDTRSDEELVGYDELGLPR